MATERFTDNDGVKIRFLDTDPAEPVGLPVVFVPGIVDTADDYVDALPCFGSRRLLVVEMRGRGGSDAPPGGYSPVEQAGDVEAVLDASGIDRFHLMTFSRGTTPALELAFKWPDRVRTLSIGDYLPAEIGLPAPYAQQLYNSRWRGQPNSARVQLHVLEGIQAASRAREFWEELAGLGVPVLVARGTGGGIIDDDREAQYRRSVPGVEVVTIPVASHDIFRSSRTAYPEAVLEFIGRRAPGD
jgi:pimeloyl-ACP methyl ester carboxylesterase